MIATTRSALIARAGRGLAASFQRRSILLATSDAAASRILRPRVLLCVGFDPVCSLGHVQAGGFAFRSLASDGAPRRRAPRRRRATGGSRAPSLHPEEPAGDDDDDGRGTINMPTAPVRDRAIFAAAAKNLLDNVELAVKPMEKYNDVFIVKRQEKIDGGANGPQLTITLAPGDGEYSVQVDEDSCTIVLSSPMSGTYTYVLSRGEWLGMDDGHIFEGMLTRDLIRQCNGLPSF